MRQIQNSRIIMRPFSLSPNYCLANVLPDRCSTRPAIPGVVSRVRGLPDYDSSFRPAGVLSPGAPAMPISPKLAPTDTPGVTLRFLASTGRLLPNCSLCAFTHNHVYTKYVRVFRGTGVTQYWLEEPLINKHLRDEHHPSMGDLGTDTNQRMFFFD